ncbi:ComEA family DNA-binding protein [Geodermatophilus sp. SYSU D01106]
MRLTSRRDDDADVIRARLRVLLAEGRRSGWLPEDDPPDHDVPDEDRWGEEPEEDAGRDAGRDAPAAPGDDLSDGLPPGLGRHRAPARTVRVDPGRRGSRALWAAGLLAALLLAGWTWLDRPAVEMAPPAPAPASASPPPADPPGGVAADVQPADAQPADAQLSVVVSVVGLVVRPGLVTLPQGSRVADAVAAAGGLLPEADPASVNLAAVVADGEQVAVGVPGAAPAAAPAGGAATAGPVDLNTATVADLDALPGIGPVLAQRIVDHRQSAGRFTSVEQLDDVPGIGPSIYADLADRVRV